MTLCPHGKHPTFRGDAAMFCDKCNALAVTGAQARRVEAEMLARRIVDRLAVSPNVGLGDRGAVEREVVEAIVGG